MDKTRQGSTGLGHAVARSLPSPSRQARPVTRFKHKRGLTGRRSGESGSRRARPKTVGKAPVRGGKCQVEVRVTRAKNGEQRSYAPSRDRLECSRSWMWAVSDHMPRFLDCETEKSGRSARKAKSELVVC